jgi:hypothetical protein
MLLECADMSALLKAATFIAAQIALPATSLLLPTKHALPAAASRSDAGVAK